MKRIIATSITAFSLSCASYAFAGGPDVLSTGGLNNHWYAGIIGGAAINIANNEASYQNNTGATTSQSFNTTSYDPSGMVGAQLGYLFNISNNNQIGLSVNINYDVAADITDIWHIESNIAESDPMDLKNSIKPQWQYNLLLNFMHDLGDSFSIGVDTGFSLLQVQSSLSITDVGTGDNKAAPGNNNETSYLPGGLIGIQASFLASKNSSLDFNLNYYIYAKKNLSTINQIDLDANDSLTNRKLYLSIPALVLKYTYHF